jgi:hypothetical protein
MALHGRLRGKDGGGGGVAMAPLTTAVIPRIAEVLTAREYLVKASTTPLGHRRGQSHRLLTEQVSSTIISPDDRPPLSNTETGPPLSGRKGCRTQRFHLGIFRLTVQWNPSSVRVGCLCARGVFSSILAWNAVSFRCSGGGRGSACE